MKQLFLLEDDMSLISGLSFAVKKQGYEIENINKNVIKKLVKILEKCITIPPYIIKYIQ